jgi:ElaB/YqjD/DUF883 family membrane-anchored ribosome-binding protein
MNNAKINSTAEASQSAADDAVDASERFVDGIRDRIDDVIDTYADTINAWSRTLTEQTKANPLLAVGVAFAAGAVISKLLRR